jgi:hypothetical protein
LDSCVSFLFVNNWFVSEVIDVNKESSESNGTKVSYCLCGIASDFNHWAGGSGAVNMAGS